MKIVDWSPKFKVLTAEMVIQISGSSEEIEKEAEKIRRHYLRTLGRPTIITWKERKGKVTFEIMIKCQTQEEGKEKINNLRYE